jgi:hypothetical protein
MLSLTLNPIDGHPINKHPLVISPMKDIYNLNPSRPMYQRTWNVNVVFDNLKSEEVIDNQPLPFVSEVGLAASPCNITNVIGASLNS